MKNRWLIAASAVGIHLSIGSVYAWSVFNLPLENAFGWAKSDIAITFSLAIFFLGMSAAVLGHFVERYGPRTSGMVAAAFWGTGLIVASLGVKLGILWIIWLGYGVLGGIGLGVGKMVPGPPRVGNWIGYYGFWFWGGHRCPCFQLHYVQCYCQ